MKFKFIHCNILNGGRLMDNLVEFLRQERPDVLAMQEVFDGREPAREPRFRSIAVIGKAAGLAHVAFAPTQNQVVGDSTLPYGNAVLSRFPVTQTGVWFYDVPFQERLAVADRGFTHFPCNLQHVTIGLDGEPLHVFNTHGIWDRHGRDNPRRLQMGQTIADRMAGLRPAILCGDFNVNEGTKTIDRLGEKLTNVFAPDRRKTSFNVGRKPKNSGYVKAVVDFIFTTDDLKVLSHRQPDVDVSDHLPLVCEFEI